MKTAFFGPWVGELGWELMAWQGFCRLKAKEYDKIYVSSFSDMEFLYQDFVDVFVAHDYPNRKLDFENIDDVEYELPDDVDNQYVPFKHYKVPDQQFIQYGDQLPVNNCVDILIHARNIRIAHKNYPEEKWEEIVNGIREVLDTDSCNIASIGKSPDLWIKGSKDLRGIPLGDLCDSMANSQVVIGGSSGIMHLATLCKAPIIVWGDRRTYFNETLETRYRKTWNPFSSEVHFLYDDKWQPNPQAIIENVRIVCQEKFHTNPLSSSLALPPSVIEDEGEDEPKTLEIGTEAAKALTKAVESGRYLFTISWVTEDTSKIGGGSNYKFAYNLTKHDFPDDQVIQCLNHHRKTVSQSPSAKAEIKQLLSTELHSKKRFT